MSVPDHWLLFCFEMSLCIFENMIRLRNERFYLIYPCELEIKDTTESKTSAS